MTQAVLPTSQDNNKPESNQLLQRKIAHFSKPLSILIEWRQWRQALTKNPNSEMPPSILHLV
jgi:hypothetical protein